MVQWFGERSCWGKPKQWEIHKWFGLLVSYLNMVQGRSPFCFVLQALCRLVLAWLQEERSLSSSDRKCSDLPSWKANASGWHQRPVLKVCRLWCCCWYCQCCCCCWCCCCWCCWSSSLLLASPKKWFPSTWKKNVVDVASERARRSQARARRSQNLKKTQLKNLKGTQLTRQNFGFPKKK